MLLSEHAEPNGVSWLIECAMRSAAIVWQLFGANLSDEVLGGSLRN